MARLNQWAFRGQLLNSPNVRIRKMTGPFSLPPIRGEDFLTMGRTGRLFVPKLHDSRRISLEIIVRDVPTGVTQGIFDQFTLRDSRTPFLSFHFITSSLRLLLLHNQLSVPPLSPSPSPSGGRPVDRPRPGRSGTVVDCPQVAAAAAAAAAAA